MNNYKIVIVDDEPINLMLLEEMTKKEGYTPKTYLSPLEALDEISRTGADLLIIDYNMPVMDGITLFRKVKEQLPDIMSIMITANNEESVRLEALKEGVTDFLTKPILPSEFMLRMNNIVRIHRTIVIEKEFSKQLSIEVEKATATIKEAEHETLRVLSKTAEYKDPETTSHIARVAHYSKLMGKLYGLDEREQEILFYGAPLHDIGKVGIEDAILLKPGKLTDEEFNIMKQHASMGYDILLDAKNPYLAAGALIAQSHHEKYNGRGYPQGLKGEEIPLYGRIVAIADVFDALTSIRPYKRAWSFEEAMELIVQEKGEHFDPVLADLFIQSIDQIRSIYITFSEE